MQKSGMKGKPVKEGKGYQCLHPAKHQRPEILSLVVPKTSKVISPKLEATSIAHRTKNKELTRRTRENDVSDGVKS